MTKANQQPEKRGCRSCGEAERHLQTCNLNDCGVDGERTDVLESERAAPSEAVTEEFCGSPQLVLQHGKAI